MAKEKSIKLLMYYLQKLKTFFFSKDILSFLLFLAISAGFWYIHALGKERERTINIPIRYVGVPMNINFTNSPPTEISLNVKDQGLRLFDYSNENILPLTIDVGRNFLQNGEILISSEQLKAQILHYLKPTTTVLEIRPTSILLKYEKLSVKIVPIVLNSKIELMHQYMFSDSIELEPTKLSVYGPRQVLDTLKSIQTVPLILNNVNDTCFYFCKLKTNKLLKYSILKTRVGLSVEQFTERTVQIPINTINCPESFSIRTFPAFVSVTYNVGLSHFNSLNSSDIQVYVDYNDLKSNESAKQTLKIKNNTKHISNIRIKPSEAEFILEQK